ncbi:MAG: zinc metallopeptidase, partial [Chryseolinea sp.]
MGIGGLLITGVFMLIGWIVSSRLKGKFRKYSEVHLTKDLTGADVARLMLPIDATEQQYLDMRQTLGLNDPVLLQFGRYVLGLLRGDFGISIW